MSRKAEDTGGPAPPRDNNAAEVSNKAQDGSLLNCLKAKRLIGKNCIRRSSCLKRIWLQTVAPSKMLPLNFEEDRRYRNSLFGEEAFYVCTT